jgi:hypothetical protein
MFHFLHKFFFQFNFLILLTGLNPRVGPTLINFDPNDGLYETTYNRHATGDHYSSVAFNFLSSLMYVQKNILTCEI